MIAKSFIIQESAIPVSPEGLNKKGDVLSFVAVLQRANEKNRNGRVYPKRVLEEAVNSPYVQERLRTKSLYAECGHPLDQNVQRQMTIDVRNAVCVITELFWEGDLLKGRCETLNTQLGRDFKGLIEQGSIVGFSLRAQGNVQRDPEHGGVVVQSPISVCTWDYVVNPSHSGAFLERICEQSYTNLFNPNRFENKQMALTEAVNLFENGNLIELNGENKKEMKDYTKSYSKNIKLFEEVYVPEKTDRLVSLTEDKRAVILENEKTQKKVMLEDYIVKDIRSRIRGLK